MQVVQVNRNLKKSLNVVKNSSKPKVGMAELTSLHNNYNKKGIIFVATIV